MIGAMPNLSHTAYGTWSAGKYMHFGEALDDAAFRASIRAAYDAGIRTFAILCYATPVFFLGLILKLIFAIWLNVRGAQAFTRDRMAARL